MANYSKPLRPPRPRAKVQKLTSEQIPPEWLDDLELLRRLINRTDFVNKPVKEHFSERGYPVPKFRIATVSTNLTKDQLVKRTLHGYKLWVVQDIRNRRRLRKEFLSQLKAAGKSGAKLVCFNELAFPTPMPTEEDRVERDSFEVEIRKLVRRYKLFLVAGSYHDLKEAYNVCPVFSPDRDRCDHAKLTSAVKLSEFVRIPSRRNSRYYETEYGAFSVLICLDICDPSLAFRLMKMNHISSQSEKIEVVFVPSFSPASMAEACRDLSYATACLVVYVNCAGGEPRHAAYLAGELLPAAKADGRRGGTSSSRSISKNVVLHEITYGAYHKSRVDVTHGYSWIFDFLLGEKEGAYYSITK